MGWVDDLNEIPINDLVGYDNASTYGNGRLSTTGFSYENWDQQNSYHQSNGYSSGSNFSGKDQHQGGVVSEVSFGGLGGGSTGGWSNPIGNIQPGKSFLLYYI